MDTLLIDKPETLPIDEFKSLLERTDYPSVSIYLPTHRIGANPQENDIRLSNLIRDAHEQLIANGYGHSFADKLLLPVRKLEQEIGFWDHPGDGLAVFVSAEIFRFYFVPAVVPARAVVGPRFFITPLLPLLTRDVLFYVLALSLNHVRLFQATPYGIKQVALPPTLPRSLADALKFDQFEKQTHLYTGTPGWGGGRSGAVFFGTGDNSDVEKTNIQRFFRMVDRGLHPLLREETAPVVVASVGYLLPLYREANTYPYLALEGINGNPDETHAEQLRRDAWEIVRPHFDRARNQALERCLRLAGTGQTTYEIAEVVRAAFNGQVDTLFTGRGAEVWGVFDIVTGDVEMRDAVQPGAEELVNLAAIHTVINRGEVFALEPEAVPGGQPAAAVMRY